MPEYQISEIAAAITSEFVINYDYKIKSLLTDSRTPFASENSLFFAIQGKNHDGNNFIQELYKKGVRNFVISKKSDTSHFYNANFIYVNNTIKALQQIAEYHRKKFEICVLAITGSNGKTIVKEWISQLLNNSISLIKNPKSYNSQIGVPISVWNIEKEHQFAVFEAGISQKDEMIKLERILSPTVGLFTNIGDAHQENFENIEQKIKEKLILFKNCNTIIYCKDHISIDSEIHKSNSTITKNLVSWGFSEKSDYQIKEIKKNINTTNISLSANKIEYNFEIPFTDNASVENAIHSFVFIDNQFPEIKKTDLDFINLSPIEMRLEIKKAINNSTLINDSYSCDIASLKIALEQLNLLNQHKKKTVILSDIQEVNHNFETTYKEVAFLLEKYNVNRLFAVGKIISEFKHLFKTETNFYPDTKTFLQNFSENNFQNEDILVKAARSFTFEKITNALQEKNHRTVLEINLEALIHNLNYFRSLLKPETKIMIMVKAFSYGSGTYEIANLLQNQRVDYLGVAIADEGVELRKNGIYIPVIIMNPEKSSFYKIIDNNLEPEIYNISILDDFNKSAEKYATAPYPIHIKLDTGMHRLGFFENELDLLISKLKKYNKIKVASIFSHLVGSSEKEHDNYTIEQINRFKRFSDKIIQNIGYKPILHILNSGGIENWQSAQFDMVRLGIGLYGISSDNQNKLMNISTLKTNISQIKYLKKDETVGYSRKGILERDSKIAVIPIGYADGLNRKLSNKVGKVLVNNKFVPIIGNICMDMSMIDITDIEAFEGDEVTIFGNEYPVYKIAELLGTIPYEVLTSISQRVKRIYFNT